MYENLQYCKETTWQTVHVDCSIGRLSKSLNSQSWQLDDLGNWTQFNNNGTTETRTHNAVNEIVSSSSI